MLFVVIRAQPSAHVEAEAGSDTRQPSTQASVVGEQRGKVDASGDRWMQGFVLFP